VEVAVDPDYGAAQVISLLALHLGRGAGQSKKLVVQEGNAQTPDMGSGFAAHMDSSKKYAPDTINNYKRVVLTATNVPRQEAPTSFYVVYCKVDDQKLITNYLPPFGMDHIKNTRYVALKKVMGIKKPCGGMPCPPWSNYELPARHLRCS
jgi:hypothetical protein